MLKKIIWNGGSFGDQLVISSQTIGMIFILLVWYRVILVVYKILKLNVKEYIAISGLFAGLIANRVNLNIVKVYTSKSEVQEEKVEAFKCKLEKTLGLHWLRESNSIG